MAHYKQRIVSVYHGTLQWQPAIIIRENLVLIEPAKGFFSAYKQRKINILQLTN